VLALIEKRFMVPFTPFPRDHNKSPAPDGQLADTLEDMFDFENSPLLNTAVSKAARPDNNCRPFSGVSSTP
jgi:hypothetical protein